MHHASCEVMSRVFSSIAAALALVACGPPQLPRPVTADQIGEPAHSAASVEGEVLGVDHTPPSDELASGTRVELRTDRAHPVVVDLAPDWYLDQRGIRYSRADRVRVQGAYVEHRGRQVFYANSVTQEGRTIELRDEQGRPLWPARSK